MGRINKAFWSGKKVFITGHTGFKGSWLSIWLKMMGADLIGYALDPNTSPSLFELAYLSRDMTSVIGDVRDLGKLQSVLISAQPDIVIHMAAQPLVRESYRNPVETYEINVMGTVNLLEAVRHCPSVRSVVIVTTDKCYENKEWVWGYREDEPLGGYDPYSNSKACSELVASAYRQSFFNPRDFAKHKVAVATARAGNVIGGGDWAQDRLIPDILNALENNKAVNIRSPHSIRPWQFVLEPLSGYLMLAQSLYEAGPRFAEAWNFGPDDNDAREVKWIVETMIDLWGKGAKYVIDDGPKPHEASYLKLEISKAKARLGWKPVWNLATAIKYLLEWHKAYLEGADMKTESMRLINTYLSDMDNQGAI